MKRRRDRDRPAAEYEVGYARPPVANRFKPGQSGNPKGRPKGVQSPAVLLGKLLNTRVTVQEKGRARSMTVQEVMYRNLVNAAVQRDYKALHALLGLVQRYPEVEQAEPAAAADPAMLSAEDAEILATYLETHRAAASPPPPLDTSARAGDGDVPPAPADGEG